MCTCSFGMAPSTLMVTPEKKTVSSMPVATIMDHVPMKNVMPFGMCQSMANPAVAAATAAAPWSPGSPTVLVGNTPALNQSSKTICAYGGVIQITNPGTTNIQIP